MNKKLLYETIMRNVSKEVKKVLNEGFNFEDAFAYDAFTKALKDERLVNVFKGCGCEDINDLVKECQKLAISGDIPEKAPLKISSLPTFAKYILIKHFDENAIVEIKGLDKAGLSDLANCICSDLNDSAADSEDNEKPEDKDDIESKSQYNDEMHDNLPARRELPECGNNKKPVKECGDSQTNECNCGNKKPTNESVRINPMLRRRRVF